MTGDARVTVVAVIDVAADAVALFQRYEELVLPLLAAHEGTLDRRLRTPDGTTEVHVLSFPSEAAYRGYVTDPRRAEHRSLLDGVELTFRVVESLTDA